MTSIPRLIVFVPISPKLAAYLRLMRADKPIGWLLLLWPTCWGLWFAASGWPGWKALTVFTLGVWLTRAAGCVINDYADRWLDASVERTRNRPLATGEVSGREALWLFVGLMLIALALVSTLNRLAIGMSVLGALLAASYPYLKRHTYLPQVYLGMAFGWGIPMAFAALQGHVPPTGWLLYIGNIFWTTAYDTWYAMVDREDDIAMGSKSTAILFGDADLAAIGLLDSAAIGTLALAGARAGSGWLFFAGLAAASGLLVWELRHARGRGRPECFRVFRHNNWVGLAIFLGIALDFARRAHTH